MLPGYSGLAANWIVYEAQDERLREFEQTFSNDPRSSKANPRISKDIWLVIKSTVSIVWTVLRMSHVLSVVERQSVSSGGGIYQCPVWIERN